MLKNLTREAWTMPEHLEGKEGLVVTTWVCFQVPSLVNLSIHLGFVSPMHIQLLERSRPILKLTGLMEYALLLKGTTSGLE